MLSVSYAGKNAHSAGKTSGVLRGGVSGANRCYVLAHCGGGGGGVILNYRGFKFNSSLVQLRNGRKQVVKSKGQQSLTELCQA